jgi:hypothetical protein
MDTVALEHLDVGIALDQLAMKKEWRLQPRPVQADDKHPRLDPLDWNPFPRRQMLASHQRSSFAEFTEAVH